MPAKKLRDYLDNHHVKYVCISHSPAYTSQEVAAAAHVSGKNFAKTVIIKIDDQLAMAVLPAHDHINFALLKETLRARRVDLAAEMDFKWQFPECEVGAMPPFGNLYEMPVYVSNQLPRHRQIIFNAGSHGELMQMAYSDFERLVKPKVILFTSELSHAA